MHVLSRARAGAAHGCARRRAGARCARMLGAVRGPPAPRSSARRAEQAGACGRGRAGAACGGTSRRGRGGLRTAGRGRRKSNLASAAAAARVVQGVCRAGGAPPSPAWACYGMLGGDPALGSPGAGGGSAPRERGGEGGGGSAALPSLPPSPLLATLVAAPRVGTAVAGSRGEGGGRGEAGPR